MAEFTQRFPDVKEVIVDGTERPVQRPQNRERKKEYYSGKKKRHTCKQITVSTRKKRVIILTKTRAGNIYDKRLLQESEIVQYIPDEVAIERDLGFQRLQKEFVNVHLSHKKPKGKELTQQQKQENRELSRQRVVCEHAHAGIKRYNSVYCVYKNRVPDFDDHLMLVAAGLWNFYLDAA